MNYAVWKRAGDLTGATLLLVLLAPVWLVLAVLLLLFQGRPLLFRQQRVGLYGVPFSLYKFRTMIDGAPPRLPDRPVAKAPDDPRVTTIGRLLRRTGLDELPQVFNILRGDMSLVGPRPLPLADLQHPGWLETVSAEERARRLDWLERRHQVRPGLTGRWQITDNPAEDFDNWIACDLAYAATQSLRQDLVILWHTPMAMLRGRRGPEPRPASEPEKTSR